MNNFKLLIGNIKNYGLKNILLIIIFEGIYSLNTKFRKHIFYDETYTDNYEKIIKDINEDVEKSIEFNAPYSPTPIYFLTLIKKEILKISNKLEDYCFIDFGCGAGRSLFFFYKIFKKKIGIDINNNFKIFFKNKEFLNLDLRNLENAKIKLEKIDSNYFFLYFYEPFEQGLVEQYIKIFAKKKVLIVTINVKPINDNDLIIVFKKEFLNKTKNITIYSNKI